MSANNTTKQVAKRPVAQTKQVVQPGDVIVFTSLLSAPKATKGGK